MHKFHIKVSGRPLCECTANGVWDRTQARLRELCKTKAPGHTATMSCAFEFESDAIQLSCIIQEMHPNRVVEVATGGCPLYGADAMQMQDDEQEDIAIAVADTHASLAHTPPGYPEFEDMRGYAVPKNWPVISAELDAIDDEVEDGPTGSGLRPSELNKDSDKVMSTLLPDHLVNRKNPDVTPTMEDAIDYINTVDGQLHEAQEQFDVQAGLLRDWKDIAQQRGELLTENRKIYNEKKDNLATMNRMFASALMLIHQRAKQEDGGSERAWLKQQEHINGLSSQVTETETGKPTDTE